MAKTQVKALQTIDVNSKFNGPIMPLIHQLSRNRYLSQCVPLHQAALKGDWEAAKVIVRNDPTLVKAPITEGGETALHIAAIAKHVFFVVKLVEMMERNDLEIKNNIGNTALFFAAVSGTVQIAKALVKKNDTLPTIRGSSEMMPLYMAALLGHSEMAAYLYPLSDIQSWTAAEKIELLTTCISSGLYDVAFKIIEDDQQLAVAEDKNGETPLHVLARNSSTFAGGNEEGIVKRVVNIFHGLKVPHKKTSMRSAALKLLQCLCECSLQQEDLEFPNLSKNISKVLFVAAKYGNADFLVELLRSYPDFIWKVDAHNRSIFHIAVLHRHKSIFSLIYEIGPVGELIATYRDTSNNNILHLAATLAPRDQLNTVSGAALQMQRELLWYKEVEKIVQPSYRDMENVNGDTPGYIFTEEHKQLLEEGKEWMRETAKSCMVVATLIAIAVFASSSTVPGGKDNTTGTPILVNERLFVVYSVSKATTMFCSSTSMLMFLSILTSRYSESDFLRSLPFQLMIGLTTLFFSLSAMMSTFCATFLLSYRHGFERAPLLFSAFACVPLMFILSKYRLLVDIIFSVYGLEYLFQSRKCFL